MSMPVGRFTGGHGRRAGLRRCFESGAGRRTRQTRELRLVRRRRLISACVMLAVTAGGDGCLALLRLAGFEAARHGQKALVRSSACQQRRESNGRGEHRSTRQTHSVRRRDSDNAASARRLRTVTSKHTDGVRWPARRCVVPKRFVQVAESRVQRARGGSWRGFLVIAHAPRWK